MRLHGLHNHNEGPLMDIRNAVVLITGANRGIGLAFVREAIARGARKVYAGVRNPASIVLPAVETVQLDVTSPRDIACAAKRCRDVTLLINNAGIATFGGFLQEGSEDSARQQLETNFFGPLRLAQAFAPVLGANGGGAMLNVLSVASWVNRPILGAYGASKSAAWALTNGLRHELRAQRTQVVGMHMSFVDTDLTKGVHMPKVTPAEVVKSAFDGLEAGAEEILADEVTREAKRGLTSIPPIYLAP